MEKQTKLNFDNDFLLDSAQARYEEGDYFGALTILNKRERMNKPVVDAYEIYADVYETLGLWPLAADAWFRFLDTCSTDDFSEGYEGLAVAFMNMGNEFQSEYYYRRALLESDEDPLPSMLREPDPPENAPALRLVHAEGMETSHPELLEQGLALLKSGSLEEAREVFAEIPEESSDYPSAAGLSAMCTLMMGEDAEAEKTCEELIARHPDNVQILTTYCAVLGALEKREEAKEVARRLDELPVSATDDLYRIATALCETGLHSRAYAKLTLLKERLPYDENVLWFHAVAGFHMGELDEAICSLETLTTLFPRKEVALWYLGQLRMLRDGEGEEGFTMTYFYRLPESKYRDVAGYLLEAAHADEAEDGYPDMPAFDEMFRLAFDEMEGHDEKLQLLASKVAVKCRADDLLREVLLDCEGDEIVKLSILHDLVCRNEEDSYGSVILNIYKELPVHRLDIGEKKSVAFLQAFADVYSKYALLGEESEIKICDAGEEIYYALSDADALALADEREALAAAIYRESRLHSGERSIEEICKLFDANELVTKSILNFVM